MLTLIQAHLSLIAGDGILFMARILPSGGRERAFLCYGRWPRKTQDAPPLTWLSARSERFIIFLALAFVGTCFGSGIYRQEKGNIMESLQSKEDALSRASKQDRPAWAKEGRIVAERQANACPECAAELVRQEGCRRCPRCGWSACE